MIHDGSFILLVLKNEKRKLLLKSLLEIENLGKSFFLSMNRITIWKISIRN